MMKRNLFLSLIVLSLAVFTRGQTTLIEVSGPVSGSWNADTVLVTGDIEVPSGELLTIGPGTLVLFSGHFMFTVKGSVKASGTSTQPVRFTILDTTGFHDTLSPAGGWHGFVYEHLASSADSSLFTYCLFEYGKAFSADTFGQYGGAFRIFDFNRIAFRQCTFSNNLAIRWGGAVYARNSDVLFDRCAFAGNRCGLAIFPWGYGGGICSVHAEPVIVNCQFDGNAATGFGGGASFEYSDPLVQFNTFTENFGGLAGGFGYLRSMPSRVATNNLVHGNTAQFFGGGVACIRSNTVFSNLTITDNVSMYGGGFYCNDSAVPILYNTILRGNQGFGHEVYIWDVRSAPSFLYCNVEGDTTAFEGSGAHEGFMGSYLNNIDSDAMFRETGEHPYALLTGSPCIDAGTPDTTGLQLPSTDMEGLSRIWNGRIDIGAYEWNPGQGLSTQGNRISAMIVTPNPSSGRVSVCIEGLTTDRGSLAIYDLQGRTVMTLTDCHPVNGKFLLTLDLRTIPGMVIYEGIYIITYQDNQRVHSVNLIIHDR